MEGQLANANNGVIGIAESTGGEESGNVDEKDNQLELDDGISLTEGPESFGEKFERYKNLGLFQELGNLGNELYKGSHSIADTLYVDGGATGDWKPTAQRRESNIKESEQKRKERVDREKDGWANDKKNISIMTEKYMKDPAFREKYSDKPEPYIRRKAEEKAKSALKDMSAYVEYGITDVNLAYQLYDNANKNGLSPEQSIRHMAETNKNNARFVAFNNNAEIVAKINSSGAFERNDYTSVEAAIPNAKTYYDAGYKDINSMAWVEQIAKSLGKSPEFAMQVDQALKKKGGKITYNGKDKDMKKAIDQINARYGG